MVTNDVVTNDRNGAMAGTIQTRVGHAPPVTAHVVHTVEDVVTVDIISRDTTTAVRYLPGFGTSAVGTFYKIVIILF